MVKVCQIKNVQQPLTTRSIKMAIKKNSKGLVFRNWMEKEGTFKLAKQLGVNPSCISHWKRGNAYPSVKHMIAIKKLTKGKIRYEDIIESVPDKSVGYNR